MNTFDDGIRDIENALKAWNHWNHLDSVTFLRDIYGKITLFLEGDTNGFAGTLSALIQNCEQRAGAFFGGRIIYEKSSQKNTPLETEIINAIKRDRLSYLPETSMGTEAGTVKFYLLERTVAKKAWMQPSPHENSSPWSYEDANSGNAPKIVTFYSFKGGMGRTTAMAGVGMLLAKNGSHVVMADTDVEAPGLASLFFPPNEINHGVLDYFLDKRIVPDISIANYSLEFDLGDIIDNYSGSLRVVPAGEVNDKYLTKLARLDFQEYQPNSLYKQLSEMLTDIRNTYPDTDYILLDARAGFHDLGGVALSQVPHGAILFGNDSDQSWAGIQQAVRCAALSQNDQMFLIMAASMSEPRTSERYADRRSHFSRKSHIIFSECYYQDNIPNIEADDEPHYPVMIDYNAELRQNLHFYPIDGVSEETRKAQIESVTSQPYQELLRRIKQQFIV